MVTQKRHLPPPEGVQKCIQPAVVFYAGFMSLLHKSHVWTRTGIVTPVILVEWIAGWSNQSRNKTQNKKEQNKLNKYNDVPFSAWGDNFFIFFPLSTEK